MAYDKKFRLKVLAAVDRGESQAAVARWFDIHPRSVRRYRDCRDRTGDVAPLKTGPQTPRKFTPADDATLRQEIGRKPGVTAKELLPLLSAAVSISAVCRRLIALGLSLKKSR